VNFGAQTAVTHDLKVFAYFSFTQTPLNRTQPNSATCSPVANGYQYKRFTGSLHLKCRAKNLPNSGNFMSDIAYV